MPSGKLVGFSVCVITLRALWLPLLLLLSRLSSNKNESDTHDNCDASKPKKKIHFDHNKEINKKAIKIHIGRVFSDHAKKQKPKSKEKNAKKHTRDKRLRREHLRRDDDVREGIDEYGSA